MIHREADIIQWGEDRGIYRESSDAGQFCKFEEEVGELEEALSRANRDLIQDAIGDCIVCLVHIAQFHGLTLQECIEHAWQEIKDRKGQMRNGVFVKEEE